MVDLVLTHASTGINRRFVIAGVAIDREFLFAVMAVDDYVIVAPKDGDVTAQLILMYILTDHTPLRLQSQTSYGKYE